MKLPISIAILTILPAIVSQIAYALPSTDPHQRSDRLAEDLSGKQRVKSGAAASANANANVEAGGIRPAGFSGSSANAEADASAQGQGELSQASAKAQAAAKASGNGGGQSSADAAASAKAKTNGQLYGGSGAAASANARANANTYLHNGPQPVSFYGAGRRTAFTPATVNSYEPLQQNIPLEMLPYCDEIYPQQFDYNNPDVVNLQSASMQSQAELELPETCSVPSLVVPYKPLGATPIVYGELSLDDINVSTGYHPVDLTETQLRSDEKMAPIQLDPGKKFAYHATDYFNIPVPSTAVTDEQMLPYCDEEVQAGEVRFGIERPVLQSGMYQHSIGASGVSGASTFSPAILNKQYVNIGSGASANAAANAQAGAYGSGIGGSAGANAAANAQAGSGVSGGGVDGASADANASANSGAVSGGDAGASADANASANSGAVSGGDAGASAQAQAAAKAQSAGSGAGSEASAEAAAKASAGTTN